MNNTEAYYDDRELAATAGMPQIRDADAMSGWLDGLPTKTRHLCVITCWDRRVGNAGVTGYVESGYLESHGDQLLLALRRMAAEEPVAIRLADLLNRLMAACSDLPAGLPQEEEDYQPLDAIDEQVWPFYEEFRAAYRRYFDSWE